VGKIKSFTNLRTLIQKREIVVVIVLLVIIVFLSFTSTGFFTFYNIMNVLNFCSTFGIISIGMTIVMVSGGIDLSVGSIFALVSMFALSFQPIPENVNPAAGLTVWARNLGMPFPVIIFGSLTLGAIAGLVNGFLIVKLRLQPFIVTMATMMIFRGLALFWSHGFGAQGVTEVFGKLGGTYVWGVPSTVIWYFVLLLLFHYILHQTSLGRRYYLVGTNKTVSYWSGLKTDRLQLSAYVLLGILTAISAILYSSWTTTVEPWAGRGFMLTSIASVLIGGGSTLGGQGSIFGTFLGVLIFGFLFNAFAMLRVGAYASQVVEGVVILGIVLWYSIKPK